MNAPIPFTRRLDREPRIEEMASALVRAHDEAGLDLNQASLAYAWLHAAMYTDGQISAFGDASLGRARARVQVAAGIDSVACIVGMALGAVAVWLFLIGFTGPADAAILSHAGVDAGGDVWLGIVCLIIGLWLGHKIGWLQYGKRVKVCAPYPEEDDHGVGSFDYRNARQ